ncbi:hypothetical protein AB0H86_09030 [Streptomyces sp. NPDC050997]|uniref:hypothetical protein n=1 Tax=Streptomyces sp. NPDC050997 TaxID=3155519 RepID=UPI00342EB5D0
MRQALRAINWEKMAAITASAAAAIGLIFSAWTTYISQEVARDQLTQSEEQKTDEERSQAALVNAWDEQKKEGTHTLVIANRSLDPIKDAVLGLVLSGYVGDLEDNRNVKVATLGTVDSIPPCSKIEVEIKDIYATDRGKNLKLESTVIQDYFLSFRDANAKEWERQKDGRVHQVSQRDSNLTQNRYLSAMETDEFDGPHQAQIDQALDAYLPLDCKNS